MVPAFNDYCFDPDTPLGEMGIVKTSFGAHIIKLTKKP
jgi:parvulin-like peptidyl-prolyl isomerase